MILTKCLELEGYEVMTASDGKQALEMFTAHTFELAFLDIKLPEIRGTEVLKRIRELGIKTPVNIITAYDPQIYLLISKAYEGLVNMDNAERFYRFYKSYHL